MSTPHSTAVPIVQFSTIDYRAGVIHVDDDHQLTDQDFNALSELAADLRSGIPIVVGTPLGLLTHVDDGRKYRGAVVLLPSQEVRK